MKNNKSFNTNPLKSLGIFFIALGLMLLGATVDVLGWGNMHSYFRWEMLLIFISLLMFLHGNLTGGVIMLAVGSWFLLPELYPSAPAIVRTGFWPAVLVLAGITFLIPSPGKWCNRRNE
jgi:hypothetical protein